MVRIRTATESVSKVGRDAIDRALRASMDAKTMERFYHMLGMRNPSRSYFVRFGGRLHSLKAVVTQALREEMPKVAARDFHAADAAERLRELRFEVLHNAINAERERQRVWIGRLAHPCQAKFRESLIDLYGRCVFSSCSTLRALEAAHVDPVKRSGMDDPSNGILLRADLHKLFDADLIAVDPENGRVHVAAQCRDDYGDLLRDVVFHPLPRGPDLGSFEARWQDFNQLRAD